MGCNIGMNCYYALSRGAKFTYGIDRENISIKSKTLLNALGVKRSEIFGLDLNSNFDLNKINNLLVNRYRYYFLLLYRWTYRIPKSNKGYSL